MTPYDIVSWQERQNLNNSNNIWQEILNYIGLQYNLNSYDLNQSFAHGVNVYYK